MIYYLILDLVIDYSEKARGKVILTTTTDDRAKVLEIEIACDIDANLDALVTNVDPNVLLPSQVDVLAVQSNYCYDLTRSVTDTIDLNTVYTLIQALVFNA